MTGTPTHKGIDTMSGILQFLTSQSVNDTKQEKLNKINIDK